MVLIDFRINNAHNNTGLLCLPVATLLRNSLQPFLFFLCWLDPPPPAPFCVASLENHNNKKRTFSYFALCFYCQTDPPRKENSSREPRGHMCTVGRRSCGLAVAAPPLFPSHCPPPPAPPSPSGLSGGEAGETVG